MIFALDLEGVLIPEIWVEAANKLNIKELHLTTREKNDFNELMKYRIDILKKNHIKLNDLKKIAKNVLPYSGVMEFLAWLRRRGQIMIISDTFHELSDEIVYRLGGYNLYANKFIINEDDYIIDFKLRIRGRKNKILECIKEAGFYITAVGDSHNDLNMLKRADTSIFYNPPEILKKRFPDFLVANNYDDLKNIIENIKENE